MKRVVIYPKDVMLITGKSERYARKLLSKIKTALNKKPEQFLTVKEFCAFSGLSLTDVSEKLIN
ncbi:MAG: hypothetical protein ABI388_01495 [Bacteroidia bacterium]